MWWHDFYLLWRCQTVFPKDYGISSANLQNQSFSLLPFTPVLYCSCPPRPCFSSSARALICKSKMTIDYEHNQAAHTFFKTIVLRDVFSNCLLKLWIMLFIPLTVFLKTNFSLEIWLKLLCLVCFLFHGQDTVANFIVKDVLFSSMGLIALHLTCRSMIKFELIS